MASAGGAGGAVVMNALLAGLAWCVGRLVGFGVLFGAMERRWPQRPEQPRLRPGWRTDLTYFVIAHCGVVLLTAVATWPARWVARETAWGALQARVAGAPLWLQVAALAVLADLVQYWVHRAAHRVPALWRIHRIHHSSTSLDWLAASRLHLAEVLATRGLAFVPICWLGFAWPAVAIYAGVISLHAVWTHVNARLRFGWLEHVLATPHFHHWHHAAEANALDRNFAAQFPWLDRCFGTFHAPVQRFPYRYGLLHSLPLPEGYWAQLRAPFAARRASAGPAGRSPRRIAPGAALRGAASGRV